MASMARDVFCIPASSSSSERAFSESGMVITDKRTRLDPQNAEKLIFCQQNYAELAPKIHNWQLISDKEVKETSEVPLVALDSDNDNDSQDPSQIPDTEGAYPEPLGTPKTPRNPRKRTLETKHTGSGKKSKN